MNAHPDDFSMDDDLSDLSQAYRNASKYESDQEPPPALDAAILAAAHRAVASRPMARQPRRFLAHWRLPLATAASFLVGVSVVMLFVPEKTEPEIPILAQAPKVPQALSVPEQPQSLQIPSPARVESMEEHKAPATADRALRSRSVRQPQKIVAKERVTEAPQPLENSALMAEEPPLTESMADDMPRNEVPQARAATAESQAARLESRAVAPAAARFAKPAMRKMPVQNPRDWLEEIEKLHREGKIKEARTSLAEFRKYYPDHELPKALRDL
ncbi:MAG: hypothetical protein LBE22_04390 [Azoarcus sp.]|jgi:Meckel syndrome type 1 protein|nr:hypothetical protein [Azoarcus sp.]